MKRDFLADSYDAVKRIWNNVLGSWYPLYARARFIPQDLWDGYTRFTGIRLLEEKETQPSGYLLVNDPDTGIRLPTGKLQREGRSHVRLQTIAQDLEHPPVRGVITYDQSHYRHLGIGKSMERDQKRQWLIDRGLFCFYFDSHAPFLFTFRSEADCQKAQELLLDAGIPQWRIEAHEPGSATGQQQNMWGRADNVNSP